ncbi:MAG: glycosyltransferase family 4 protein [Chromatiales bacterium]|nr:glycosyltransferase family 4 protein [Chromatiales bacterium]
MRVVLVNRFFPPDLSATSQLVGDLAADLAARGVTVEVVASRQRIDAPAADLPADECWRGVRVRRVWSTRCGRESSLGRALDAVTFLLASAWCLRGALRPGDVVVAKTDPPLLCVMVARIARRRGARLVNWIQDLFPEVAQAAGIGVARGRAGAWLRRLRDVALGRAAVNVCIGERMAERVRALVATPERVVVIPNWADETRLVPDEAAVAAVRGRWGAGERLVVGYAGNLGRVHEHRTLIGAARALAGDDRVRFVVVGGGRHHRRLAAADLSNLTLNGYVADDEVPAMLGAIDVHVVTLLPSMEGLVVPSKIYGVLAAGRPTIFVGDPAGEVAELLRRHACGVTVAPGDVAGLVDAVARFRDDPARRRRMGRAARALACGECARVGRLARWRAMLAAVADSGAE